MKRTIQSFKHALKGLEHALRTERNLRRFVIVFAFVLLAAAILGISRTDWMFLLFSGAGFTAVELLNTALERFVDTFEEHRHLVNHREKNLGLQLTKDIASAAALIAFCLVVITILVIFVSPIQLILTDIL